MSTDKNNQITKYAATALVTSLKYHRNELLRSMENEVRRDRWPTVRKKLLDHLGERGIEGLIKDLLSPTANTEQQTIAQGGQYE